MDIVYYVDYKTKAGEWKPIVNLITRPIDKVEAVRIAKLVRDYNHVDSRVREELE